MDPEIKDLVCKLKEVCMKRIDKIENEALKERASDGLGVIIQLLEDETSAADIIKTCLDIVDKMYSKDKFVLRKDAKELFQKIERKHSFSSCLIHVENAADVIDSATDVIDKTIVIKDCIRCLKAYIGDKTSEKTIAKKLNELFDNLSIFCIELHTVINEYFEVCESCSFNGESMSFLDVYQEKPYLASVYEIIKYLKKLSITKENVRNILKVVDRYIFAQDRIIKQIMLDRFSLLYPNDGSLEKIKSSYQIFDKYDSIIRALCIIIQTERKSIEDTLESVEDDIEECDHKCCIITDDDDD